MAERTFDYSSVAEVYQKMLNITEEISDLLEQTDTSYHDAVNVSEEAIYGDLGQQLLLDWDNTASSFPNFVSNFENWSAVISASGGDYSKFEEAIKGFQTENPLGSASGGLTENYIASSVYTSYYNENIDAYEEAVANMSPLYELTGAEYVDTGTKANQWKTTLLHAGEEALAVVSLIGGVKGLKEGLNVINNLRTGAKVASTTVSTWSASGKGTASSAAKNAYIKAGGSLTDKSEIAEAAANYIKNGGTGDDALEAYIKTFAQKMGTGSSSTAELTYDQAAEMAKKWLDSGQNFSTVSQSLYNNGTVLREVEVSYTNTAAKTSIGSSLRSAASNISSKAANFASKVSGVASKVSSKASSLASSALSKLKPIGSTISTSVSNGLNTVSSAARAHPIATGAIVGFTAGSLATSINK